MEILRRDMGIAGADAGPFIWIWPFAGWMGSGDFLCLTGSPDAGAVCGRGQMAAMGWGAELSCLCGAYPDEMDDLGVAGGREDRANGGFRALAFGGIDVGGGTD